MTKEKKIDELINNFIKQYIPMDYPHLVDTDENDGERLRNSLKELIIKTKPIYEYKRDDIGVDLWEILSNPYNTHNPLFPNIEQIRQKLLTPKGIKGKDVKSELKQCKRYYPSQIKEIEICPEFYYCDNVGVFAEKLNEIIKVINKPYEKSKQ
jgi:hypothetical protein